jgi:hypothetical protein
MGGGALLVAAAILAACGDEPPAASPTERAAAAEPEAPPPTRDLSEDVAAWSLRVEEDEVLGRHPSVVHARPPYLVFVEHAGIPEDRARAEAVAREQAEFLSAFYEGVLSLLGESLDLSRIEERPSVDARWFGVFVLRLPRERAPFPVHTAWFWAEERWLLLDERDPVRRWGSLRHPDSARRNRAAARQVIHAHECALDARPTVGSLWFSEGFAEFLASTGATEDGGFRPRPHRLRLREWKLVRKNRLAEWPLDALLSVRDQIELRRKSMEIGGITGGHMGSLFTGQSWAFVHYLWSCGEGKHRKKLLRYARAELRGRAGPDVFARLFFGDRPVDWSGVEAEWRAHVKALWKELGIE